MTPYTPAISPQGGTGLTYALDSARFLRIGRMVHVIGSVVITGVGTSAGGLEVALPVPAIGGQGHGNGFGTVTTSPITVTKGLAIDLLTTGVALITVYDGSSPLAAGNRISFCLVYQGPVLG